MLHALCKTIAYPRYICTTIPITELEETNNFLGRLDVELQAIIASLYEDFDPYGAGVSVVLATLTDLLLATLNIFVSVYISQRDAPWQQLK